jgi:hypothetical protein
MIGTNPFDDGLGIVVGKVIDVHRIAISQDVDHEHVGLARAIVFDDPFEVARARNVRHRRRGGAKVQTVRLDGMAQPARRADRDAADVERIFAGADDPFARNEAARVRQHDRLHALVERVARRAQRTPRTPAPLAHRFDHHVDVAGVIEMFVREHDRVERGRVAGRHLRERANERPGARIDVHVGAVGAQPEPGRRTNLLGDHPARAAGPEKLQRNHPGRFWRAAAQLRASR